MSQQKVQHNISFLLAVLIWLFTPLALAAEGDEFPGRALYPDVEVISIEQLKQRLADVQVVDVRSSYEYDTLRIKGAINIPLSDADFATKMANLRVDNVKDIVVYCNGKTCMKSYKAAEKCAKEKIPNVYAYDAGIMDWAKAYPDDAELLGKTLGDPKRLISKETFKKHLLSPEAFGEKVSSTNALVMDVRDRFQRDSLGIFPGRERRSYLDDTNKLDRMIDKAKQENRTLLIYDASGKQVRWFQYYLENKGVTDYYFMQGGAHAYYKELTDEFLGTPKQ